MAGHAAASMSRNDLKELGELLDAGQAGLVVVAPSGLQGKVEQAMCSAERLDVRPLKADTAHVDWDAEVATAHIEQHHPLP
jgi:hypothetical protein